MKRHPPVKNGHGEIDAFVTLTRRRLKLQGSKHAHDAASSLATELSAVYCRHNIICRGAIGR
jgi:hypothetical protein